MILISFHKIHLHYFSFDRKIKIFPKSIVKLELHAKSNRLYVQCMNDPLIYAIEITSAVVIQTINFINEADLSTEFRTTFTVSPCGSLIFTKCINDDQIKCIRISNDEQIGHFRIPISVATRKYSVTSLTFHSNKNLVACSIFGDAINSCLILMYNENDSIKNAHDVTNQYEDDLEHSVHTLDEWHTKRAQEIRDLDATNGIKSHAIDSILNRIDDLFFMAIQSPQYSNDIDQFKEMQQFLETFRLESPQLNTTDDQHQIEQMDKVDAYSNEVSCASGESKKSNLKSNVITEMPNIRNSWQLQSTTKISSKDTSNSDSSHHTFDITKKNKSDENEMSHATYSIESDTSKHSNLTFEVSTGKI